MKPPRLSNRSTGFHIEGRRWWDRMNTYHSVRIYKNGVLLVHLPFSYGYGEQFLQTAFAWLAANGMPKLAERENGTYKYFGTRYLREVMKSTYSVADVARKRDL